MLVSSLLLIGGCSIACDYKTLRCEKIVCPIPTLLHPTGGSQDRTYTAVSRFLSGHPQRLSTLLISCQSMTLSDFARMWLHAAVACRCSNPTRAAGTKNGDICQQILIFAANFATNSRTHRRDRLNIGHMVVPAATLPPLWPCRHHRNRRRATGRKSSGGAKAGSNEVGGDLKRLDKCNRCMHAIRLYRNTSLLF